MLPLFSTGATESVKTSEYAHLLINECGKIITANQYFVDLVETKLRKRIAKKDTIGKTIHEVFGKEVGNTFVGIFMKHRRPFTGQFMIGNELYQVVVEEIAKEKEIYYEFFYLPIKMNDDGTNHRFLQNIVYEIVASKGYTDIDWIRHISDDHCKELISCLITHEHSIIPERYCPYKHRCEFNSYYGSLQLDRRAFYRIKVNFSGELYLKALKDRAVPPRLARKKMLCQALDLSMEGIKLQLENCLPEGSVVRMVFKEFEAEGTVIWTRNAKENWLTGIKFLKLDEEQQNKVITAMTKRRIMVKL